MAKVTVTCAHCGALFQIFPWQEKKEGAGRFCSRSCYHGHRSIILQAAMVRGPLTMERMRELFDCDPDVGVFTWRVTRGKAKAGEPAGYIDNGYVAIVIDGHKYMAHRLVWFWVNGEWPKEDTDHRNADRADNRIANLRDVPRAANLQNRKHANKSNKSSGLLGAYLHKRTLLWHSAIEYQGRTLNLGRFKTAEEAHLCFLEAKRRLHPGNTI